MKRIIIIMAALLAVLQLTAADIDMMTAQATALLPNPLSSGCTRK